MSSDLGSLRFEEFETQIEADLKIYLLHCLVGANMRPPLHMFPKAAWPDLHCKCESIKQNNFGHDNGVCTRPVGAATPDPGNPGNSTASSPRLSRGLKIKIR